MEKQNKWRHLWRAESRQQHLLVKAAAPGSSPWAGDWVGPPNALGPDSSSSWTLPGQGRASRLSVSLLWLGHQPWRAQAISATLPPLPRHAAPRVCPATLPSRAGFKLGRAQPHLLSLLFPRLLILGERKVLCSNYSLWVPQACGSCSRVAGPGHSRRKKEEGGGGPRAQRQLLTCTDCERQRLGGPGFPPLAS